MIASTFSPDYQPEFPMPHGFVDVTRADDACPVYQRSWEGVDLVLDVHHADPSARPGGAEERYVFSVTKADAEPVVVLATSRAELAGAYAALMDSIADLNEPDLEAAAPHIDREPDLGGPYFSVVPVDPMRIVRHLKNARARGGVMLHKVEAALPPGALKIPNSPEDIKRAHENAARCQFGWKPRWSDSYDRGF